MLVELILEFNLKSPSSLVVHAILKLVIFVTKQKDIQGKSSSELFLTAKNIAKGNVRSFPSPGSSQLQNLSQKRCILNVNCE